MGQDRPYSSWRLTTKVLGGCLPACCRNRIFVRGAGKWKGTNVRDRGPRPVAAARAASSRALQTVVNLTNVSALLWRLDTLGCDIGDRWREVAALWQGHADGKRLVFSDIHAAIAELRSGEASAVERRLQAMRETAASAVEAAGLYRTVGIPVVEGLAAFHRGAYLMRSSCCCQSASIYGILAGAARNATSWTGP